MSKLKPLIIILALLCLMFAGKEIMANEQVDYKAKYEELLKKHEGIKKKANIVSLNYLRLHRTYVRLQNHVIGEEIIIIRDKKKEVDHKFACRRVIDI